MEQFWNDLYADDVHVRDDWQFEIVTNYSSQTSKIPFFQEFFLFIPSALKVDAYSYSKEQFYRDRTNLIRLKTPEFTLEELLNIANVESPFTLIEKYITQNSENDVEFELKLLANIIRSTFRRQIRDILSHVSKKSFGKETEEKVQQFCQQVQMLSDKLHVLQHTCQNTFQIGLAYIAIFESISQNIEYYLTNFLAYLRQQHNEYGKAVDEIISKTIIEHQHRIRAYHTAYRSQSKLCYAFEDIVHHKSALNKLVLDALILPWQRLSWVQQYGHLVGALAAGIAMLFYVTIFAIKYSYLDSHSMVFILLTVILYILKDRIKEGLKIAFQKNSSQLFCDYTTNVMEINKKRVLGALKENARIIDEDELAQEIIQMRTECTEVVRPIHQHETVIHYTKTMRFKRQKLHEKGAFSKLTDISLFNLRYFLEKASNAFETTFIFDAKTKKIISRKLPKVYHIHLLIRTGTIVDKTQNILETKMFRLIVDKNGIKRIERLTHM